MQMEEKAGPAFWRGKMAPVLESEGLVPCHTIPFAS